MASAHPTNQYEDDAYDDSLTAGGGEAHRRLCFARDHTPEEYRDAMIEKVPLHRDIMAAWEEQTR